MKSVFKLKENKTNVRTEIFAGITSFMTMAYIIALNPNILTNFGLYGNAGEVNLWNAVFLATCLSSGIAMIIMAFVANKPYCLAPGMGLNNFFATVVLSISVATGLGYIESFQAALVIMLIEGVLFLLLSFLNVREKLVNAIPLGVRIGIAPAIGLLLLNVGFGSNMFIPGGSHAGSFYMLEDFFGSLSAQVAFDSLGSSYNLMIISIISLFVGLFLIILLDRKKVKGSVLIGMLASSVLYWILQGAILKQNPFASLADASWLPPFKDMAQLTLFKFNFEGFAKLGWFSAISLVVTYCMIDMFDTIGTLVGTASRANMMDKEGNIPGIKECLISDAAGTVVGACTGTSTVTTFIESASGIEMGGRTGLTSLTCGILFLLSMFLSPLVAIIPAPATSAALIYVGILMVTNLKNLDFSDPLEFVPAILMLIAMPISGSIGNSIGIGIIASTVLHMCAGKFKKIHWLTYVLAVLFLLKFFLVG